MNITVIVLGVVVIILLYFLFKMFYNQVVGIDKIYLGDGTKTIDSSKINNIGSTRYNYATWVYVNSWNNNYEKKLISKSTEFQLSLDRNSPTLLCKISTTSSAAEPQITITDNFPVQKWVYVIVSVDNQIIDCYIDGKLVISRKLTGMLTTPGNSSIVFGDANNPDIYLVSPKRNPTPMDPQTAWNNYLMGNGMGNTNSNIKMSYLQDNIEKKYISIPV